MELEHKRKPTEWDLYSVKEINQELTEQSVSYNIPQP